MSNTDTTNTTRHCDQCAVLITDENQGFFQWRDRCNRCHSRPELDDNLIEIAHTANKLYSSKKTIETLQHTEAELYVRIHKLNRVIEDGGDPRLSYIWSTLWDALDGDIERDETWDMFINAIAGDIPDYRTKMFEVDIPLETITITVEAKDEDEAIELAMEEAESDYSLGDVIYQPYIRVHEA